MALALRSLPFAGLRPAKAGWPDVIATLRDGPLARAFSSSSTSSRSPNMTTWPSFRKRTLSATDSVDGRCPTRTRATPERLVFYRLNQCGLSRLVAREIGVGLVEDNEARTAKYGTGQSNSLALTTRQPHAAIADVRVIALREVLDHLVGMGKP